MQSLRNRDGGVITDAVEMADECRRFYSALYTAVPVQQKAFDRVDWGYLRQVLENLVSVQILSDMGWNWLYTDINSAAIMLREHFAGACCTSYLWNRWVVRLDLIQKFIGFNYRGKRKPKFPCTPTFGRLDPVGRTFHTTKFQIGWEIRTCIRGQKLNQQETLHA